MAKILDEMDDQSKVGKDALIYQKREDDNSKEAYEALDKKGKIQFFKDYYLKTVAIILAVVIVGVFALKDMYTKPKTILYIAVIGDAIPEDNVDALEKDIATYLNLNQKKETVDINTSFSNDSGEAVHQLETYLYSGSCDIVIASQKDFQVWSEGGYFFAPESSKLVSFYKDYEDSMRFYSKIVEGSDIRGETKPDETEYNFGISLSQSDKYKALKGQIQDNVIGIANSSKHQDEAQAAVQYLLDNSLKAGTVSPAFQAQK